MQDHASRRSSAKSCADSYRRGATFNEFIKDYPALLGTCHSLRASIADGYLLDYLIIDEASQVNLLLAGLAMSCARNVVVFGDQRQPPPIPVDAANGLTPPAPAYGHDVGSPAFLDHACEHDRSFPRAIGILPPPVVRMRPRVPPKPVDQPPDLCHLRACHAFIQAQEADQAAELQRLDQS